MKKTLPHLAAVLTFLVVTFAYLSPLLSGQRIFGNDTQSYVGMAKEASDYNAAHDDQALWTDAMFGGMPTYQICMEQPTTVLTYLDHCLRLLPDASYRVFLYLVGFYILLICMGVNPWISIACSIAFAFGSYNLIIIVAGHNTNAVAIAYMAPIVGSVWLAFRRNAWTGGALLALFLGLGLYANHIQITYYTLLVVICLGVYELISAARQHNWKPFGKSMGLLTAGALLAVGLNATRLLTTAEYVKATMRGESNGLTTAGNDQHGLDKDYITQWSYGIGESFTLLIPNFYGGASSGLLPEDSHTAQGIQELTHAPLLGRPLKGSEKQRIDRIQRNNPDQFRPRNLAELMYTFPVPLYWGDQPFTAGPVYAGAIVCFLFLLGLLLPIRDRWWLLAAALLGLLLSWGHNFMPLTSFFIDYIPLYGKFRTVSMTLTITRFAMATLAALALKAWMDAEIPAMVKNRALYIAAGVTAGLCLLFGLFPGLAGDFTAPSDASYSGQMAFLRDSLVQDRMDLLRGDAFRSLAFVALAAAVCWFYANRLLLRNRVVFAAAKQVAAGFRPTLADQTVMADTSHVRTLNLNQDTFNSSHASYFYPTVGGYSAVKLRRYQELIDLQLASEINRLVDAFSSVRTASDVDSLFLRTPVLNMLNTRYIVYRGDAEPLVNRQAYGNAWLVREVYTAPSPDDEVMSLTEKDLRHTVVMDSVTAGRLSATDFDDTDAGIRLLSYSPNELKYACECPREQLAVFSEIHYYKGWHAYADGRELPVLRGDWLLRAVELPAGSYELTFRFAPDSYRIGTILALISSILLTTAFLGIIFALLKRKKAATVLHE